MKLVTHMHFLRQASEPTCAAVHIDAAGTLAALPPGASGAVAEIVASEETRRRLYELGLLPGTRVECLYESPMGDPKAYRIRGVVMAIRARDAAAVRLRPNGVAPCGS